MVTQQQRHYISPPQNEQDEIEIEVEVHKKEDLLEREPASEKEEPAPHSLTGDEDAEGYNPAEELERARKNWSPGKQEEGERQSNMRVIPSKR